MKTDMKQDDLSKFRSIIDADMTSREWSAGIAKNVKRRIHRRFAVNITAAVLGLAVIGTTLGVNLIPKENAYTQFYAYISESAEYDYDILDLQE